MAKYTNVSTGPRGLWTDQGLVMVEPGETVDVTLAKGETPVKEWFKGGAADPLDHDNDGKKGGSLPEEPPALSGKNKAELLEIAEAEGVTADDSMKVEEIKAAIEAGRQG